ncbi:MAG: hypothetical protein LCH38_00515 [Proteobacteria bacterium]|nr:hypothetical protein [Pseudomonadota bacterium]
MRAALIAASCGLALLVAGAAQAQEKRRLVIELKPRSWLDAGKVVRVGSMQNYVTDLNGFGDSARFGARGATNLPDRFSSGRGFTINTPNFYFRDLD